MYRMDTSVCGKLVPKRPPNHRTELCSFVSVRYSSQFDIQGSNRTTATTFSAYVTGSSFAEIRTWPQTVFCPGVSSHEFSGTFSLFILSKGTLPSREANCKSTSCKGGSAGVFITISLGHQLRRLMEGPVNWIIFRTLVWDSGTFFTDPGTWMALQRRFNQPQAAGLIRHLRWCRV